MSDTHNLLDDERFVALARRQADSYLPWEEFLDMIMPASASVIQTWELLTKVEKCKAVRFPISLREEEFGWYTLTREIAQALSVVDRDCGYESALHEAASSASGRSHMIKSQMDEAVAVALLEGIDVPSEQSYEMLVSGRAARNDGERLVKNMFNAVTQLDAFVDSPFSGVLLEELLALVTKDVSTINLGRAEPAHGAVARTGLDLRDSIERSEKIELICDYANGAIGEPREHHAIRAVILQGMIQLYQPFSSMSSFVGYLAFRLYLLKHGLPLLGALPINKVVARWSQGEIEVDKRIPYETFWARSNVDPRSLTDYLTLVMIIIVEQINELRRAIANDLERNRQVSESLADGDGVNHRQCSILNEAVSKPSAEFTIAKHKNTFGVSYATARADLLDLVEAGIFIKEERGRAFVFSLHPKIKSRLNE